jgi:S-adenosylmethionine-diacylglycerol 3-amino-3-carboxypropyl transferase
MTEFLAGEPEQSCDAYVLLDAQDWMGPAQLQALWHEIGRTARPGARVIFRTAGKESPLPQGLTPELLAPWHYEEERSRALLARDRSAIYGGFHLYRRSA